MVTLIGTTPNELDPLQPHVITQQDGGFYCPCTYWGVQRSKPIRRTCAHLVSLLGEAHEAARAPESFYGLTSPDRVVFPRLMRFIHTRRKKTQLAPYLDWWYAPWPRGQKGQRLRWYHGQLYTAQGRKRKVTQAEIQRLPRDMLLDVYRFPDGRIVVIDVLQLNTPFEDRLKALQKSASTHKFTLLPYRLLDAMQHLSASQKSRQSTFLFVHPRAHYTPGQPNTQTTLLQLH